MYFMIFQSFFSVYRWVARKEQASDDNDENNDNDRVSDDDIGDEMNECDFIDFVPRWLNNFQLKYEF